MLKMAKVELELLPDADLHIYFEKPTRGRVSYISNRYNNASNKYLKCYDPKQESNHIIYLNNLHGYAMCKFLPSSAFTGIDPKEFHLSKYTSNSY